MKVTPGRNLLSKWWHETLLWTKCFRPSWGKALLHRRNEMAIHRLKGILGVVAAGSFMLSSTAAVAATQGPAQQIDPWAALTVLSGGAPAATICGAAAAAAATAQAPGGCVLPVVDAPPPLQTAAAVPPPPVPVGGGLNPIFLALAAIIVGVGIYAFATNHGENTTGSVPISAF